METNKEKSGSYFSQALRKVAETRDSDKGVLKRKRKKGKTVVHITSAIDVASLITKEEEQANQMPEKKRHHGDSSGKSGLAALLPPPKHINEMKKPKPKVQGIVETVESVTKRPAKQIDSNAIQSIKRAPMVNPEEIRARARAAMQARQEEERMEDRHQRDIAPPVLPGILQYSEPEEEKESIPEPSLPDVAGGEIPDKYFAAALNKARNGGGKNVITVSGQEVMKRAPDSDNPSLFSSAGASAGDFTSRQRYTHSLKFQYHHFKQHESEYDERRAKGLKTKAETYGKYGW